MAEPHPFARRSEATWLHNIRLVSAQHPLCCTSARQPWTGGVAKKRMGARLYRPSLQEAGTS